LESSSSLYFLCHLYEQTKGTIGIFKVSNSFSKEKHHYRSIFNLSFYYDYVLCIYLTLLGTGLNSQYMEMIIKTDHKPKHVHGHLVFWRLIILNGFICKLKWKIVGAPVSWMCPKNVTNVVLILNSIYDWLSLITMQSSPQVKAFRGWKANGRPFWAWKQESPNGCEYV